MVEPSFRHHLLRAMALPLVALAAGSGFLVAVILYLQGLHRSVDHADVLIGRVSQLQRLVAERENSLRGYLLSQDALFLGRFNVVDVELSPAFDTAQDLAAPDPFLVELLRSARVEVIRFRHLAAQQVDRVRDGVAVAELASHLREGVAIGDKTRGFLRELIDVEQDLRVRRSRRADTLTWYALALSVGLGLLLGSAVSLSTGRQMRLVRTNYLRVLNHQRLTKEALAAANTRLQDADRHKDAFLSVLSHELRNPLAPIRNCVHILGRPEATNEQIARARTIIGRQVDHLTRLVEDLLDVKRLSAGKMRLSLLRIDLVAAVREVVEDLRPFFARKSIVLELHAVPERVWVNADATRLAQVAGNLLHNAAKFTNVGGNVNVSVEQRGGEVLFRIRDDGVGIAPEVVGRLFDPFVQAEQTLDRSRGGLGLGLALVRGIVDLHGGSVSVRSAGVGHGTEFDVVLPIAIDASERTSRYVAAAGGASRRCVLIIEDDEDAAASLREVMELAGGHEVHVAHDGADGILAARQLHPDVILCDLGLAVVDGYEVARQLQATGDAAETTLVAVSGYATPEDMDRVRRAGFQHHLAKPADIDTLLRIIAEVPAHQRAAVA